MYVCMYIYIVLTFNGFWVAICKWISRILIQACANGDMVYDLTSCI